jgi:hypothetical protein
MVVQQLKRHFQRRTYNASTFRVFYWRQRLQYGVTWVEELHYIIESTPTGYTFLSLCIKCQCLYLFRVLLAHLQALQKWYLVNYWMVSTMNSCYIMLLSNIYALLTIFSGKNDRHIEFLISPISSYCYDLMETLPPRGVLMQLVSEYETLAFRTDSYNSYPFCRIDDVIFH